jgi:hypothetical protein
MPDLDLEGTAADRGEPGEAGDERAPEADRRSHEQADEPADEPADDVLEGAPEDDPEDDLQDRELSQEIELVGDLVVAASDADADLSTSEIDRILGLGKN